MSTDRERIAGVVVADATKPGFPLLYVSEGFELLTGYSGAEVLGGPCSVLQGPESDPRAIDVMSRALADGRDAYVTVINYRRDGTPFWNEIALAPEFDEHGEVLRYHGVLKDVSARIAGRRRSDRLTRVDPLTGLANRAALREALATALASAQVNDRQVALLWVDIDDFRAVNDAHGYAAGDLVLRTVADRLRAAVRPGDVLARAGADEFLLLVRDVEDIWRLAEEIARRVVRKLREPIELPGVHGAEVSVRASVGVSGYPRDAATAEELLAHADHAVQIAKDTGKDRVYLHRTEPIPHAIDAGFDPSAYIDELRTILAEGTVTPVFQPIVSLETDAVIAYEALARGPRGTDLERPDHLFATADAAGLTVELDWLCRARAVEAAMDAGLGSATHLFINCEPCAVGTACPERHSAVWTRAQTELQLVLEITERALTSRPAELSRVAGEHLSLGRALALDDIGADVRSLALLPFIEPDVIKLDLRLVQDRPSPEQAAIVAAVAAESERTGALILAEGIETHEHLEIARGLGANLAQGFRWGRPGPIAPGTPTPVWQRPMISRSPRSACTPFQVVAVDCTTKVAPKSLLLPMSHHLENRALSIGEGAVLLAAFQEARHFTPATATRYRALQRGASFVAAFAAGLGPEPIEGVRGATIPVEDALAGEWSVIVVGPHFAGALVAQDLGDDGVDAERRFAFATTYRRDLVIAAARTLLERVAPVVGVPGSLPAL